MPNDAAARVPSQRSDRSLPLSASRYSGTAELSETDADTGAGAAIVTGAVAGLPGAAAATLDSTAKPSASTKIRVLIAGPQPARWA